MKVGVTFFFQNQTDYFDRWKDENFSRPASYSNAQCYRDNLRLAELCEPLGYDSVWTVEHHFGPYGLNSNPLQFLSYMAGRTSKIKLGTMVVVLPWHDPIRVAEAISMLDVQSGGDRLMLGFGRGAAPHEFECFRVDYKESRNRMDEALEIVRLALTQEFFEFDGKYFKIPRTSVTPEPLTKDITKNMWAAWSSEESMTWAANSGCAPMYNNFARWEGVIETTKRFNDIRATHGWHATPPLCGGPVFVSESKDEAEEARHWYRDVTEMAIWHYGLFDQPTIRAQVAGKSGAELEAAVAKIYEASMQTGVFGTPDECIEQLVEIQKKLGLAHIICNLNFGRMSIETAEKNMRLFAKEVLPVLQAIEVEDPGSTAFADVLASREETSDRDGLAIVR